MFPLKNSLGLSVNAGLGLGLAFRSGPSKFEGQLLLDCRSQLSKLISIRYKSRKSDKNNGTQQMPIATLAHQTYQQPQHNLTGEKSPIVILHGLLGSKSNWGSMAKGILNKTKERRVITVDLRNHGESTHTFEFTYELMASDLIKFLHDENIKNATLIGHSLGGRVCMLVAMLYPALVDKLIVVDISPVGQSPNMLALPKIFQAIKNLSIDPFLTLAEVRKQAAAQLKEELKDDGIVNFILTNLVEDQRKSSWRWKFNLDSIIKNFNSEICRFPVLQGKYTGPTLFVAGGNSDYIKVEQEPLIKEIFPTAQFVYIPGAGHWVHAEKPHEFLAIATNFININSPL